MRTLTLLLAALGAAPAGHGIDLAGMNKAVAPGDDFNAYVSGSWLSKTEIPKDRAAWGVDSVLAEEARKRTVELIQEAAKDPGAEADAKRVGDYYAAFMDEAAIE